MAAFSLSGQKILNPSFSWKRIPYNLRVALVSTFVIGVVAHFFCYTNVFFNHDDASMYWYRISLGDAATGTRWLTPLWQTMVACVQIPWLEGIFTLFFYSLSVWLICETLEITYPALIVLVSGILVTSPTAISSNMYLSSAHQYAGALLFACLALYAFEKWKHGWFWAFGFLLVSAGTYASYVNLSVTLFLMLHIVKILTTQRENPVRVFWDHLRFLLTFGAAMVATSGIVSVIIRIFGTTAQGRVDDAIHGTGTQYLENLLHAVDVVVEYFSPFNDLSYFQENPLVYGVFSVAAVCSLVLLVLLFIKNRIWQQPLRLLVLVVDILCLPLAMNLIGMFYQAHTLMQIAFVVPWLLFVLLAQRFCTQPDLVAWVQAGAARAKVFVGYAVVVAAVSVVTIVNGIYLANVSYMKAYAIYESGLALTNRIVDRIEATPDYVAGQTRVLFVGDIKNNYAPYRYGFAMTDSVTGIGRYSWDTSLTYNLVLSTYIEQQLGIQMQFLNPTDPAYADTAPELLAEAGVSWADESEEIINGLEAFPSQNCIYLQDDVLIIKLSD